MVPLKPALERFHRQLCCLVSACTERLPGIDTDRQPTLRNCRILPARNNVEVIADREAGIGFLPLLGPVAFFNDRTRNGRTLTSGAKEQVPDVIFNKLEIAAHAKI